MRIPLSKHVNIFTVVSLIFFIAVTVHSSETDAGPLPKVRILAMGGTIAGTASSPTETKDYKPGTLDIASIVQSVPGLQKLADISGEQIANVDSSHMTNDLMLKLSRRINQLFATNSVDGIVVTHGTDTLEETAYFLNLTVKSDRPVVVVGSMRPATAISADGPLNLYNAVVLAAGVEARGRGVLVALNEGIHSSRFVTKTNTTSVDTFRSSDFGALGYILDGKPFFYQRIDKKHTARSEFHVLPDAPLPRVDIIFGHGNSTRDVVDAMVAAGTKGIIVAGMGNGGIYPNEKQALADAAKKGVVIIRASRTGSGVVTQSEEYRRLGFLTSNDLNPQKARILLMLALANKIVPTGMQRIFDEY